jgi:nuclear pore complex protein Nup155
MTLTPLSNYSVQTDAVSMTACAHSASGAIFLGGADGHMYEIDYGKHGRCRKVNVTQTMLSMLNAVIPRLLTGHVPSPVVQIVVDDERHFLYTLAQNSTIEVRTCGRLLPMLGGVA